jgi:hypothetical protein
MKPLPLCSQHFLCVMRRHDASLSRLTSLVLLMLVPVLMLALVLMLVCMLVLVLVCMPILVCTLAFSVANPGAYAHALLDANVYGGVCVCRSSSPWCQGYDSEGD